MKRENEFKTYLNEAKKIRKQVYLKRDYIDLIYLLLPAFLFFLICSTMIHSFLISLTMVYFVLPMHYSIVLHQRRKIINRDDHFTYKRGYDEFFGGRSGGVYGVIISFIYTFLLIVVFSFICSFLFKYLVRIYPSSVDNFNSISSFFKDRDGVSLMSLLGKNLPGLYKPSIILISLIMYVPFVFLFLIYIPKNLTDHNMMSIILPDIDKNLSSSYIESSYRYAFSSYIRKEKFILTLKINYHIYLISALVYFLISYLFTLIDAYNIHLFLLYIAVYIGTITFVFIYLAYFINRNNFCVDEKLSSLLKRRLNSEHKMLIKKTYYSETYVKSEESKFRGPFLSDDRKREYDLNKSDEVDSSFTDFS